MKWFIVLMVLLSAGSDGVQGKDVRVKLCGREFIRMVVTLCGSSRLKRDVNDVLIRTQNQFNSPEDQMDHSAPDHLIPSSPSPPSLSSSSFPIIVDSPGPSESSDSFPPSRRRRDAGPAGICCRSGCTKSELVQYC
ncbi:insulin-like 3 (Leydig cell) isoform X2 [Trichomycterus rosablanca]|uniref:insulin-like 3 (Leydig cell) isoform X2 n=1 Tax=Trichomycterus rosablanca TaxID=2290929 RepID=UPI002F352544